MTTILDAEKSFEKSNILDRSCNIAAKYYNKYILTSSKVLLQQLCIRLFLSVLLMRFSQYQATAKTMKKEG